MCASVCPACGTLIGGLLSPPYSPARPSEVTPVCFQAVELLLEKVNLHIRPGNRRIALREPSHFPLVAQSRVFHHKGRG